jgi:hypothetical protein
MRIAPNSVDIESLAGATMIVVDHPGKLPNQSLSLLASLVRRGKAMLYIASEPLDATNLKLLTDAAGTDLKMPVDFVPSPTGVFRHDLFVIDAKRDHVQLLLFEKLM